MRNQPGGHHSVVVVAIRGSLAGGLDLSPAGGGGILAVVDLRGAPGGDRCLDVGRQHPDRRYGDRRLQQVGLNAIGVLDVDHCPSAVGS